MSPWKLISRCSTDLLRAMLIGLPLIVLLLLWDAAHPLRIDSHSMKTLPPDDHALLRWIRSQSNVDHSEVSRSGTSVELRYHGPLQVPPWESLGYEPAGKIQLTQSYLNLADPKIFVEAILSSQLGFFIMGLWRIRRTRKTGEPLPRLLEGKTLRAIGWGVLAGGILLGFGFLYEAALRRLLGHSVQDSSIWAATRDFPVWGKAMIFILGSFAAPAAEEIFFRGAQFGSFVAAGRPVLGGAISSLFFASCHLDPVNLVAYVVFGLSLAWLYRQTRSIVAPVVAHLVNNAVALYLLFGGW